MKKILLCTALSLALLFSFTGCKNGNNEIAFSKVLDKLAVSNLDFSSVEVLKDYKTTSVSGDRYKSLLNSISSIKVYEKQIESSDITNYDNSITFFASTNNNDITQMELCFFKDGYLRVTTYDSGKMPEKIELYKVVKSDVENLITIISEI